MKSAWRTRLQSKRVSFSLYLPRFYHFSFGIKSEKSKSQTAPPDEAHVINTTLWTSLHKLQSLAAGGNEIAKDNLEILHLNVWDDIKKIIKDNAVVGKRSSRLPPIGTLLEMTDFAIPLLLQLVKTHPENIKEYARDRWQWPGLIHLCKQQQTKYEDLSPRFNKAGTKITKESPIDLGKKIRDVINFNARLTLGDYIFTIAARSVFNVTKFERDPKTKFPADLRWLRGHDARLRKLKGDKFQIAAENFLRSLGNLSRETFDKWQPVFDTFLTMRFGPFKERDKLIQLEWPDHLLLAFQNGTENQWYENQRKIYPMSQEQFTKTVSMISWMQTLYFREPPLQYSDQPEIRRIIASAKETEDGQWRKLKSVILKRIEKLAPDK